MNALTGKHLIAGAWAEGPSTFFADNPTTAQKNDAAFFDATPEQVNQAVAAARDCADSFASLPLEKRANFLRRIADEIEARGEQITEVAHQESALPTARLQGERGRTTGQLRFFADWIEQGHWLEARIDGAIPDRQPLPRTDLRSCNTAVGPVAVFGASNFPLAFSTAGGDTASALAAGCPVVVKAHPAHPGTSEIVADAINAAITACDMPKGVFSLLQGGDFTVGQALVAHPDIKAVGFTGSLGGGRALFDIAMSRPEPIPFFGELGSINPVFLLDGVLKKSVSNFAAGWTGSLTMGVGQFCTNPGVVVGVAGAELEDFKTQSTALLSDVAATSMLTDRIAKAFHSATNDLSNNSHLTCLLKSEPQDNPFQAVPALFSVDGATWLANPDLAEEVFGPAAIIIECADTAQMLSIAENLQGQLTATLHMTDDDLGAAEKLLPLLTKSAGRVLVNEFPTGVEVCHAMVHGGPYPASTATSTTSVGSLAIKRFTRPVCYQNMPDSLLPDALKRSNPLKIDRLANGNMSQEAL